MFEKGRKESFFHNAFCDFLYSSRLYLYRAPTEKAGEKVKTDAWEKTRFPAKLGDGATLGFLETPRNLLTF